jgi:hypothetical protein
MAFGQQALIEGYALSLEPRDATIHALIFDDDSWRHSPLFRVMSASSRARSQRYEMLDAVLRSLWSRIGDPYADQVAHEQREQIGQTWMLLSLMTLVTDTAFMQHLTLGAAAHLNRDFPLRLVRPRQSPMVHHLPRDLGPPSAPLPWQLGPLSIFWIYGAYLVYTLSSETVTRKLAIPAGLGERVREIEDKLLDLTRRRLRDARDRVVEFIEQHQSWLTPGDLLLADGLVAALLRTPVVTWKNMQVLVRLSPISRICRGRNLLALAGEAADLREGLRPNNAPRLWRELSCVAGSDQLPGIHYRLAQALADACQPNTPSVIWEEAELAMRWLADEAYQRVHQPEVGIEDSVFWVGLLILRVYQLCQRDETLVAVAQRSPHDFMLGLNRAHLLEALFKAASTPGAKGGSGWRNWRTPDHLAKLRELYDSELC